MYGTVAREESVELNEHSDRRVIVMIASLQANRESELENRDFHRECPNNPVFS